jgi:hypothetical protein
MVITLISLAILSVYFNPLKRGFFQISETYQAWTAPPAAESKAFRWIRENTPKDSLVIAPPWREDFWFAAQRGQFVSEKYPPFLEMAEWRQRLEKLVGNKTEREAQQEIYNNLPKEKIDGIVRQYQVSYLVSKGIYDYPVMFESGNWKVYNLNGD